MQELSLLGTVSLLLQKWWSSLLCMMSVGVADGVGGWRTYGVDPSQFPKSLMAACERMVHSGQFTPRRPVDVLSSGYSEIQQDKAPLIGVNCYVYKTKNPPVISFLYSVKMLILLHYSVGIFCYVLSLSFQFSGICLCN